jgi:6-phosphofructokinase
MGDDYAENLAEKINIRMPDIQARFARLAHVQRGGSPTLRDRLAATIMGNRAVELLIEGKKNLVVCMRGDKIIDLDIEYALALDKRYKNKMSDGDFAKLCECDQKSMNEIIGRKKSEMKKLYEISKTVSV